jgi:hypothetical protein
VNQRFCALVLVLVSGAGESAAPHRLKGYVGGPYKIAVADFTGDRKLDVVLAYHQIGIVAVEQGNGRGKLSPLALNVFSDQDRKVNPNDATWSVPHVHNLAYGDIDGDGLLDLVFGVGGLSTIKKGRVIIARNRGKGRFEKKVEYLVPSQAKGMRFVDMDRDGRLDVLYTARGSGYKNDLKRGRLYIRRGLGGWKFGPAVVCDAGKSAYFVEPADLNNDGYFDIVVPNEHDSCVTYLISPGKTIFSGPKTLPTRIVRATQIPKRRSHAINDVRAADLNGDGNQDLLTANLGTSTISIFLGKGDGTFKKDKLLDAGKNGAFLGVGDFDRDGDVDFVITHWTENFASVFLNRGNGTFAARKDYKTGLGNYGVDVADINHDGHLDVLTANYRERSISILLGVGNGTFKAAITQSKSLRSFGSKWLPAK